MKDFNTLKGEIQRYIRTNNNQEITGEVLQSVLIGIVSNVGENAGFSGIAKKTTSPGTPDGPVFYFATEQGVYPNFGGLEIEKENTLNIIYNTEDGWGTLYLGNLASDEEISELIYRIQGRSENSSAYTDPFISLGEIAGWSAFTDKLNEISELENKQNYMGRCRARVNGITVDVYHFINSFSSNDFSQVVLGNVSAIKDEQDKWQVTFTPNQFNIIHRQHKNSKWTDWQRINDHPLATTSVDGLMSADDKKALDAAKTDISSLQTGKADKTALDAAKTEIASLKSGKANNSELNEAKTAITANAGQISDLTKLSQGDPEKSSAYTFAFINLGEFSGWDVFSSKLDDIANLDTIPFQKYMGRCRAKVSGITIELYNFINNFRNKDFSQVVLGNVSAIKDEQDKWQVTFTPNQFNIIHRQHKNSKWTDWQRINDHPLATTSVDGLMSADDKEKSDNYPSKFVLDLGLVRSQEEGEQEAAKSEVAGNRNLSIIRFQVQEDEKNIKTTLIMQWPDGIDTTGQIMFTDQSQFRRSVTGATGVKGNATNAYPWERTAPHFIDYDKSSRMLQLKDYLKRAVSNEDGVELPLATSTQDGLMSAEDKTKLNQTKPVVEVTWTEQHHMNAYTECGEYHIHGERKNANDGLPILNADPGHTIDATLTVLDSSLPTEGSAKTDVCVTQILRMSNRTGGDGHIFVRTGQAKTKSQLASGPSTSWGTWEKLMGIFEKNGITSVSDLDSCTTNGMYSGLYSNTSQASLGGINFYTGDTFLMITANGYAASPFGTPQLTQILFKFPVRKAPLPATANMYIRVAYWDTSDANNKRWVFGNFTKMVTAAELAALESRIFALETQLSSAAQ